jgi:hypothetical protein
MVFNCLLVGVTGSMMPYISRSIVDSACLHLQQDVCLLRDADTVRLVPCPFFKNIAQKRMVWKL